MSNIQQIILLFFLYAFLGWCCEVAFAACKNGRFVNRGFLNGPLCPIYGFGVMGVVLALAPLRGSFWPLYLGSVILTSAIELVTGWAMEKLFHARWWDYSNMPLNIMGYVCVPFSLVWGFACIAIVKWVHPPFQHAAAALPNALCIALDAVFLAMIAVDLCTTVSAVRKLSDRLVKLTEAANEIHAISDEIGQHITETALSAQKKVEEHSEAVQGRRAKAEEKLSERKARIEGWLEQHREANNARTESIRARFEGARERMNQLLEDEKSFGERRLLAAFPNLRTPRHQEAMDALRDFYEKRRTGKKDAAK